MAEPGINDWLMKGIAPFVECKWLQSFPTLWTDVQLKHLAYFASLVVLEIKTIRVVRTTCIIVNLVFSGVLRGAGGRHVKNSINLLYFDATC